MATGRQEFPKSAEVANVSDACRDCGAARVTADLRRPRYEEPFAGYVQPVDDRLCAKCRQRQRRDLGWEAFGAAASTVLAGDALLAFAWMSHALPKTLPALSFSDVVVGDLLALVALYLTAGFGIGYVRLTREHRLERLRQLQLLQRNVAAATAAGNHELAELYEKHSVSYDEAPIIKWARAIGNAIKRRVSTR